MMKPRMIMALVLVGVFVLAGLFAIAGILEVPSAGNCGPFYAAHLYKGATWCCVDTDADGTCDDSADVSKVNTLKRLRNLYS